MDITLYVKKLRVLLKCNQTDHHEEGLVLLFHAILRVMLHEIQRILLLVQINNDDHVDPRVLGHIRHGYNFHFTQRLADLNPLPDLFARGHFVERDVEYVIHPSGCVEFLIAVQKLLVAQFVVVLVDNIVHSCGDHIVDGGLRVAAQLLDINEIGLEEHMRFVEIRPAQDIETSRRAIARLITDGP